MDTVLQPHESHTNYVLQWMMDYNLQGMNPVNCITTRHSVTSSLTQHSASRSTSATPSSDRGVSGTSMTTWSRWWRCRGGRLGPGAAAPPWTPPSRARPRTRGQSSPATSASRPGRDSSAWRTWRSVSSCRPRFCIEVSILNLADSSLQPPRAGVPPVHLGAGAGRRGRGHHQPPGRDGRRHEPRPRGALGG